MAIKSVATSATPGIAHIFVEWVPLQVCVVCDVTRPIEEGSIQDAELKTLYDDVLLVLNPQVTTALNAPANPQILDLYKLEPTLEPTKLKAQFGAGGAALQPINYAPAGDARVPPVPRAFFRRGNDLPPTALLFYQIDAAGLPVPEDVRLQDSLDRVRELTNLVNLNLIELTGPIGPADWKIRAVHPNWLTTGTASEGGSPGALPEPAAPGQWSFVFDDRQVLNYPTTNVDDRNVFVAVLDTSPRRQEIIDAAAREGAAAQADGVPRNWLLEQIAQEIQAGIQDQAHAQFTVDCDDPASPLAAAYNDTGLGEFLADWGDLQPVPGAPTDPYLMPDHGLFVAGIIRTIAPNAQIRLIRVLDDFGVGDLRLLVSVLEKLPLVWQTSGKTRMVVNLSLGFDTAPGIALLQTWFPNIYQLLPTVEVLKLTWDLYGNLPVLALPGQQPTNLGPILLRLLNRMHEGLSDVVAWLSTEFPNGSRALITAAAGNDNDTQDPRHPIKQLRPEPRYPAHYDQVLGVAAINRYGYASAFSNRGDEPSGQNGVATFGGDATRLHPGDLPRIVVPTNVGIVGLFCHSTLPLHPPTTVIRHGWVAWAGTSFSTPIISAIAAKLWGANTGLTSLGLMAQITQSGTSVLNPDLMVPTIRAHQV